MSRPRRPHAVTRRLIGALGLALALGCGGPDPETPAAPDRAAASTPAPIAATPAPVATAAGAAAPTIDRLPDPASVTPRPKGLRNGDWVPELALTNLRDGEPYRLSAHVGPEATEPTRAVIVGFVASWCGPCRASLPTLRELEVAHGDDLEIVSIAADKDLAGRRKEAAHVAAAGLDAVVLDPTDEAMRAYRGGQGNVPKFYIVNKAGEVLVQDSGFGKKVKPMLPKQVRYALNHPDWIPRAPKAKKRRPTGS